MSFNTADEWMMVVETAAPLLSGVGVSLDDFLAAVSVISQQFNTRQFNEPARGRVVYGSAFGGSTATQSVHTCVCPNHYWVWSGDTSERIPEGLPCACGLTVAHWEYCPHCGQDKLVAKPHSREGNA